jgi:hypothetical protein
VKVLSRIALQSEDFPKTEGRFNPGVEFAKASRFLGEDP